MKIKKITLLAILLSIGTTLQIFENSLPIITGIPGGKLGFANIVAIICISMFDTKTSFILSLIRPILSSLIYGGIIQMAYSISGSILSFIVMSIIINKYHKFSYIGVAVMGAIAHNFAQVSVAVLMYSNIHIYTYLPTLLILSVFSGYFTGFCSTIIIQKYKNRKNVILWKLFWHLHLQDAKVLWMY